MSKSDKGILYAIRKEKRKEMARQLERTLEFIDLFFFIEGLPNSDYKKLMSKVRDTAKCLKEGTHLGKILDEDNIKEMALTSPEFANEFMKDNFEDYL